MPSDQNFLTNSSANHKILADTLTLNYVNYHLNYVNINLIMLTILHS